MISLVEQLLKPKIPFLYHISFRNNLEGIWQPKMPDDMGFIDNVNHIKGFAEPDMNRICCAPSIEKCYQAIYPNISRLVEVNKYPSLDFYVYTPILKGDETILTPEELHSKRMVHDAFITSEYSILTPTFMKLYWKIRIPSTLNNKDKFYYPFNDKSKEKLFVPSGIKYKILQKYGV